MTPRFGQRSTLGGVARYDPARVNEQASRLGPRTFKLACEN